VATETAAEAAQRRANEVAEQRHQSALAAAARREAEAAQRHTLALREQEQRTKARQDAAADRREAIQSYREAKAKQRAKAKLKAGPASERSHLSRAEHGGPLKLGDIALALGLGAGSVLWSATRPHSTGDDLYWSAGIAVIGGIAAMEAREGTELEYGALAMAAGNASYVLLRLTGGITAGG
jgi:hypothetical protein